MRPLRARKGWNCLQLLLFVAVANSVPLLAAVTATAGGEPPAAHHAKAAPKPPSGPPAFLCLKRVER